jgi:hypothetical protein
MRILFFNSKVKECGVYQYGIRVYDIIRASTKYEYVYCEVSNLQEYKEALESVSDIRAMIYNYHSTPMCWLNHTVIQRLVKNIGIIHESSGHLFDIIIDPNPAVTETSKYFGLPRPLFAKFNTGNYVASRDSIQQFIAEGKGSDAPIIGSFGFGFHNKGFQRLIEYIHSHYNAAIIKLVVPVAFYSDHKQHAQVIASCKQLIKKPGIQLHITSEFFSNDDVLAFLSSTTFNMFLYDTMHGRGISSATDYAMSVDVPFVISDSWMFRHIYNDSICLYKSDAQRCAAACVNLLPEFQKKYSHTAMIHKMDSIIAVGLGINNARVV